MSESKRVNNEMYKMSDILKDKNRFADYFSEGNKDLKECLLLLWKNNINTLGCCIGHKELNNYPYLAIIVDSTNYTLVSDIIFELLNINNNIRVNLINYNNKITYDIHPSNIHDLSFFNDLLNILKRKELK